MLESKTFNTPEPDPKGTRVTLTMSGSVIAEYVAGSPAVWDLVVADMKERDEGGAAKYGTRLYPFNGRDPLVDTYQELLDAVVYMRQALFEKYGK